MFSLAGKGAGECSAGLFDLIEVDLKQAKRLREQLRVEEPQDQEAEAALYTITLCSARALLITRGIEAASDAAVFENFRKHFIASGLIDSRFDAVVAAAQQQAELLADSAEEVYALLDAVEALYRSMDNSLRFTAEVPNPAPALTA